MFWFAAFALAWGLTVPLALEQLGLIAAAGLPQGAARLIGFAPVIAAVLAAWWGGALNDLGRKTFRWPPLSAALLALVLPVLYLAAAFAAARFGFPEPKVSIDPSLAIFASIWFVLALGEEIGWRAYALPRLMDSHGFWTGSTILGVVWAIWHYPMLLASPFIPDFQTGLYWIGLFSVQIFLANYVLCWLMVRSGAVLVPTLFHMGFNVLATAHPLAAIDLGVTAAIGATAALIWMLDPTPEWR